MEQTSEATPDTKEILRKLQDTTGIAKLLVQAQAGASAARPAGIVFSALTRSCWRRTVSAIGPRQPSHHSAGRCKPGAIS